MDEEKAGKRDLIVCVLKHKKNNLNSSHNFFARASKTTAVQHYSCGKRCGMYTGKRDSITRGELSEWFYVSFLLTLRLNFKYIFKKPEKVFLP